MAIKTSVKTNGQSDDLRARIAARAYEIYLQEGRPAGRAVQNWLAAEAEFIRPVPAQPKRSKAPPREFVVRLEPGMASGHAMAPS